MSLVLTVKENVKTIWNAPVSEQGLGFRRHTLCFSCAKFLMGILCMVLQAVEVSQHVNHLPESNSAALHYYNGFWNGIGLWLISICGILTAIFLPDRQPAYDKNSAGEITVLVPPLGRNNAKTLLNKYTAVLLKILLVTYICLFGSGLASLVLSARVYPKFMESINSTVKDQQVASLGTDLFLTTTVDPTTANFTFVKRPKVDRVLHNVRVTCLTLQGLLAWCTLQGIFLTALTGTITLNRVILQQQLARQDTESSEATLSRQTSRSASARSRRRKSVVSAVRKVSRTLNTVRNRKASTLTQPQISSKGRITLEPSNENGSSDIVQQTERLDPTFSDALRSASLTHTQSRETALQSLAEFLRVRETSQQQLSGPPHYELQTMQ